MECFQNPGCCYWATPRGDVISDTNHCTCGSAQLAVHMQYIQLIPYEAFTSYSQNNFIKRWFALEHGRLEDDRPLFRRFEGLSLVRRSTEDRLSLSPCSALRRMGQIQASVLCMLEHTKHAKHARPSTRPTAWQFCVLQKLLWGRIIMHVGSGGTTSDTAWEIIRIRKK